jgi:hypothetical protein
MGKLGSIDDNSDDNDDDDCNDAGNKKDAVKSAVVSSAGMIQSPKTTTTENNKGGVGLELAKPGKPTSTPSSGVGASPLASRRKVDTRAVPVTNTGENPHAQQQQQQQQHQLASPKHQSSGSNRRFSYMSQRSEDSQSVRSQHPEGPHDSGLDTGSHQRHQQHQHQYAADKAPEHSTDLHATMTRPVTAPVPGEKTE